MSFLFTLSSNSSNYTVVNVCIILYIYCIIGVHLFKDNDPFHFSSIQRALATLFTIGTLEDWSEVYFTGKILDACCSLEFTELKILPHLS
jgi:hypothetical protein